MRCKSGDPSELRKEAKFLIESSIAILGGAYPQFALSAHVVWQVTDIGKAFHIENQEAAKEQYITNLMQLVPVLRGLDLDDDAFALESMDFWQEYLSGKQLQPSLRLLRQLHARLVQD